MPIGFLISQQNDSHSADNYHIDNLKLQQIIIITENYQSDSLFP